MIFLGQQLCFSDPFPRALLFSCSSTPAAEIITKRIRRKLSYTKSGIDCKMNSRNAFCVKFVRVIGK